MTKNIDNNIHNNIINVNDIHINKNIDIDKKQNYDDRNVKMSNIRLTINNMITNGILYRFNNYYDLTNEGNKIYDFIVNRSANKIIHFFRDQKRNRLKLYYRNIW